MKTLVLFIVVLIACGALFFFAPHHHRQPDSFKTCTLGELFGEFFDTYDWMVPRKLGFFLTTAFFAFSGAFYPAAMVLMVGHEAKPAGGWTALFIAGGLLAILGAFVNFLAIIVSHMSFGFGSSGPDKLMTPFAWIIPGYQVAFGLLSIVIGCSGTCAGFAHRLVAA